MFHDLDSRELKVLWFTRENIESSLGERNRAHRYWVIMLADARSPSARARRIVMCPVPHYRKDSVVGCL